MTTSSSPWQIQGCRARLETGLLQTQIDLVHPAAGLLEPIYNGIRLERTHVLELNPQPPANGPEELVDSYVRGVDLIATYAQIPDRRASCQIYWRAIESFRGVAGIEVIVSFQTSLLDSRPKVSVRSEIPQVPVASVRLLAGLEQPRVEPVELSPSRWRKSLRAPEAGVFLFQLPQAGIRYAEMVYPADFQTAEICAIESPEGPLIQLTYPLRCEHLEKGVIRRARLRGIFLPADNDQALALECYRELVTASPPLTT
jgi:hypothetical protein